MINAQKVGLKISINETTKCIRNELVEDIKETYYAQKVETADKFHLLGFIFSK